LLLSARHFSPTEIPKKKKVGIWFLNYVLKSKVTTKNIKLVVGPTKVNQTAFAFDGKASYVRIPEKNIKNKVKGSFTIFAYIWQDATVDGPIIEWQGKTSKNKPGVHLWIYKKKLYFNLIPSPASKKQHVLFHSKAPPPKKWHWVGARYNFETGIASIWIDAIFKSKKVGKFKTDSAGELSSVIFRVRIPFPLSRFLGRLNCFSSEPFELWLLYHLIDGWYILFKVNRI
jgi:hypothetical protein